VDTWIPGKRFTSKNGLSTTPDKELARAYAKDRAARSGSNSPELVSLEIPTKHTVKVPGGEVFIPHYNRKHIRVKNIEKVGYIVKTAAIKHRDRVESLLYVKQLLEQRRNPTTKKTSINK